MSDNERHRFGREQSFQDRRKKADWIVKMATILSLIAWCVAIAVWVVLDAASPEREVAWFTSIGRLRGVEIVIRDHWDATLLPVAFGLLLAALAICLLAFFFNKIRMKRKTDKYRKSVIVIGSITVLGIILFIVRFGLPFSSNTTAAVNPPQAYTIELQLPGSESL